MIVVDASWVIALRDPEDPNHTDAVADNVASGDLETLLLHPVTMAECLVGPAKLGLAEAAAAALQMAFLVVPIRNNDPVRWASIRAETGLKLPDAVVLDTVRTHDARLLTFDAALRKCAG
ncbi:MAG: type II toxin-antitoxin system VapC family toxin [Actinomycetota bacterium]